MLDPRSSRAAINIRIDNGIKERAVQVLAANGMTMSGAVTAMARVGIDKMRLPFEITREPDVAGCGMSDEEAHDLGIAKDGTDGRNEVPDRAMIRMSPEEKRDMRRWCKAMAITPNAVALAYMAQIAFELREPVGF